MKLQNLSIALGMVLGLAASAQAQTFDISLSGGGYTLAGTITSSVDDGGGLFTATAGTLTFNGLTLTLAPVPSGQTEVVAQNPAGSGGLNLSGNDQIGANFISNDGLIFTAPPTGGSSNGFTGDVVNIWGNGGSSYTLACYGPDLPAGDPDIISLTGTITATPEPSTAAMALVGVAGFMVLGLARRKVAA